MNSRPDQLASHPFPLNPLDGIAYRPILPDSRRRVFCVLPALTCEETAANATGVPGSWFFQLLTSNLQPPAPSAPARRSFSAGGPPHNLFVPMHLETKLPSRKNPPLSKPFRISILQDIERLRPYPPLSKSFVFNTVSKTLQKAPLCKSFTFKHFQTSRKAPLSKPFRITLLRKNIFFPPRGGRVV